MTQPGSEYLDWVCEQRPAGLVPERVAEDSVRVSLPASHAEVNLYPYEESDICELRIVREADEEPTFFLHFLLDDLTRARELFGEMASVIEEAGEEAATPILLCCTSALTTSLFALKMGEAAEAMGLPYEFSAVSVDRALAEEGCGKAAILLAPQVGYLRRQMAEAHPGALVFEIPAKVFGSYDAPAAVRLLAHALRDDQSEQEETALHSIRDLPTDYRILVITLFSVRGGGRLGYRLYDHGRTAAEGVVRKPQVDFRDIEDLIQTLGARGVDIAALDGIGIAVPGVTSGGVVRLPSVAEGQGFDLGPHLMKRFTRPVLVHNNCNAAAVACYMAQDEFENVVFFRQELGHEAGGIGIVIDGELHRGRGSLAGEPKFFETHFSYEPFGSYDESRWSEGGMLQIATNVLLTTCSLIAPDVVYLAVDTVDDMDALREALSREIQPDLLPELRVANDYIGLVYQGTMELCARQLHDGLHLSDGTYIPPEQLKQGWVE